MRMRMRRNKHRKPTMDQRRMWKTEGIRGLTCEPMMETGVSASMVTMRMGKRKNEHPKPMIDQCRICRTEGTVLERVKIGRYTPDL
jgi:hypothetical protein